MIRWGPRGRTLSRDAVELIAVVLIALIIATLQTGILS